MTNNYFYFFLLMNSKYTNGYRRYKMKNLKITLEKLNPQLL